MEIPTPQIRADRAAWRFVSEHGGTVYVWVDDAGLRHVRMRLPSGPVDFERLDGDGLALHVDRRIEPPRVWVVKLRRFPRRRIDVLHNGWEPRVRDISKAYV